MIASPLDAVLPIVRVAFLDVGQGDTIVVSVPETKEALVIDCVDADAVLRYLEREEITRLRALVITHLHEDHYKGAALLLKNMSLYPQMSACERVIFNHILERNQARRTALLQDADGHAALQERESPAAPSPTRTLALGSLLEWVKTHKKQCGELKVPAGALQFGGPLAQAIEVVHPYAADYVTLEGSGLNNTSVVLRVSGPGSSALLTGDLEQTGWQQLLANYPQEHELRSAVLKFPHHGAWKEAELSSLLDTVDPSFVIISVGTEGIHYGHPNDHVFAAIRHRARTKSVRLLCTQATARCGDVSHSNEKAVRAAFQSPETDDRHSPILAHRGCPCAGTVVVELGAQARVLQPTVKLHRDIIIRPHYQSHQCSIGEP